MFLIVCVSWSLHTDLKANRNESYCCSKEHEQDTCKCLQQSPGPAGKTATRGRYSQTSWDPVAHCFYLKKKKKFLPLTAAQRSDTTIWIQLIRQNDLKIKQKFSKIDDSTIITRTPAQVKGSRIAPWGTVPPVPAPAPLTLFEESIILGQPF